MKAEDTLAEKLRRYAESGVIPFHMPGHKRNAPEAIAEAMRNPYGMDVTETSDTDNLHHASGILKEAMDHAASVYGTRRTFFLVNGATCGILAAVSAAVGRGEKILIGQNAHLSVYHAVRLCGAEAVFLKPPVIAPYGFSGSIDPAQLAESLRENPDVRAVFVTSPTYEGILSDIRAIAEETHKAGALLIVDQAHGAQLHFLPPEIRAGFRLESAVSCGADLVIESLHKTLPCLTQTALLHLASDRLAPERITRQLAIFETSSPSYVLMASEDLCIRYMETDGREKMRESCSDLLKIRELLSRENKIRLWLPEPSDLDCGRIYAYDFGKLILGALQGTEEPTGEEESGEEEEFLPDGPFLAGILKKDYGIEAEMAAGSYILLMTGPGDRTEYYERLLQAVFTLNRSGFPAGEKSLRAPASAAVLPDGPLTDYIYLYPPGIPIAVPGEILNEEKKREITSALKKGCRVMGLEQNG